MLKEWKDKKILFLGDSITHNGLYVDFFETYLIQYYFSSYDGSIIRLGLSSETVSGLSEVDHPFPRPCLHERLGRTLKAINPDIVFLCYGMNDGIYAAYDEERFNAFKNGMLKARLVKTMICIIFRRRNTYRGSSPLLASKSECKL